MPIQKADPLLTIAKIIVWFIIGVLAFAAFFVALGLPALAIFNGKVAAELAANDAPQNLVWYIAGLLAAVLCLLALALQFFRLLLRIVNSVGAGDPFAPENGDRLSAMAWLMLAVNLLALPVAGLAAYIANTAGEDAANVEASFDFGGLILILTLFILARVFRHGAAMREDLEGTV
ncbi:MAG: DUF2975 domain-containing protein [Erythrobacter sp.]|nr:DUF2975 domain-containing protein [Erythrobacter sp.]NCQ63345.1 DUF2975 domain-containing protein [Alphaproteobacteria bacterium]